MSVNLSEELGISGLKFVTWVVRFLAKSHFENVYIAIYIYKVKIEGNIRGEKPGG